MPQKRENIPAGTKERFMKWYQDLLQHMTRQEIAQAIGYQTDSGLSYVLTGPGTAPEGKRAALLSLHRKTFPEKHEKHEKRADAGERDNGATKVPPTGWEPTATLEFKVQNFLNKARAFVVAGDVLQGAMGPLLRPDLNEAMDLVREWILSVTDSEKNDDDDPIPA
jgi:hypothetical protein